ncbi:MAG: hypothetical protein RM368_15580 [Nostoc sp. DedSLP03]|uniref:hypothetical protein n=1 Tax=Nostoc sp. DedSLP03 TaxID=3075400 RepID=UPI002AD23C63|nr:hypothetical protein [Nostoc sp. DedSLP03]MDZ7966374.1 hypothetical protein [Nostoc sp. DedSLP03]
MRNKVVRFVSIVMAVALSIIFYFYFSQLPKAIAFNDFPLNQQKVIDFRPDDDSFKRLNTKEQKGQFLDWLLFTVVSDRDFEANTINKSLYDFSPIRNGYMTPVSNFEYGDTRSLYVGNGTVAALIPKKIKENDKQVPREITKEERIDFLTHIADKHRQNVGEIPNVMQVFDYDIDVNKQYALLSRTEKIDAHKLFTDEKYGYHETTITNLKDFENFMQKVDDITFARVNGSNVTIGGRKIFGHSYQNIRVEDVAVIWKSEKKRREDIEKTWSDLTQKPKEVDVITKELLNLDSVDSSDSPEELNKRFQRELEKRNIPNGSGFSLDWGVNYQSLLKSFKEAKPEIQSILLNGKPLISNKDIQEVEQDLLQTNTESYERIVKKIKTYLESEKNYDALKGELYKAEFEKEKPYLAQLEKELKEEKERFYQQLQVEIEKELQLGKSDEQLKQVWETKAQQKEQEFKALKINKLKEKFYQKIENRLKKIDDFLNTPRSQLFQYANYIGDLKGTEVGMTLFYTDLLAKLWGFDYAGSTPQEYIEGFQPKIDITVSPIYKKELQKKSSTRTWFEPDDKGFQKVNRDNIIFARKATKVSSRSSDSSDFLDSSKSKKEEPPTVVDAIFINWWNGNYEEIARYEPQYEKLNEIMKWSLVISWLNESNRGNILGFLENVQFEDTYWFPDWVKANKEQLKFKKWDEKTCNKQSEIRHPNPICFFKPGEQKGFDTETMPVLFSKEHERFGNKRYKYGGVSLASEDLVSKHHSLPKNADDISKLSQRPNIDYNSVILEDNTLTFRSFPNAEDLAKTGSYKDGTKYVLRFDKSQPSTTINPEKGLRFHSPDIELENVDSITRKVSRTDDSINIDITADQTNFGSLNANKTENGFTVGWKSRDIDMGNSLVLELSMSRQKTQDFLVSHPMVDSILQDDSVYYVKTTDSKSWLRLAEDGGGSPPNIPPGWNSHVASAPDPKKPLNTIGNSGGTGNPGGPGSPSYGGERSYFLAWLDDNQVKQLNQKNLKTIKSSQADVIPLKTTVNAKHLKDLPKKLNYIDDLIVNNKTAKAAQQIDDLINIYGKQPDLMFRKAIVAVKRDRLNAIYSKFDGSQLDALQSKKILYDEINILLNNPKPTSQFKGIKKDDALIYIQDHPGFNNIDWNQPIESSVSLIPSKTKVYQLQDGDIGDISLKNLGFVEETNSLSNTPDRQYKLHPGLFWKPNTITEECNAKNKQVTQQEEKQQDDQCGKKSDPGTKVYFMFVSSDAA